MSNDGLTLNQLAERNAVLVTEVEKLRAEREQLAAENVGLRPLIAENWNMRDLLRQLMTGRPGGVYFNKWEKLIIGVLNAPATDRIVAGIKADAKSHDLNAFISHYSAELDAHIESGGDQFDAKSVRLRSFIVGGRMFREKLRDEEKALALREVAK
ncbi:hypothetical protein ACNHKA_19240 [Klebsiella michiganensis]